MVRDVRDMTLERPALPAIYLPMEERGAAALTLLLRTSVDPNPLQVPSRRRFSKGRASHHHGRADVRRI